MHSNNPSTFNPKSVLGIGAHPDDLDYYAGGTMAAFAKQGADVYYLILTDGSKGSNDRAITNEQLRGIRQDEQRKAGAILGVKDIVFCDFLDGELENTLEVKREIVKMIRKVKPDVVVSLDPTIYYSAQLGFVNHPDHRVAGQATIDAVYPLARDHMSFPGLLNEGYGPHNTATLLLMSMYVTEPTFAVDITETIEQKYQALAAHASQFSIQEMKEHIDKLAAETGVRFGYSRAEPFVRIDMG